MILKKKKLKGENFVDLTVCKDCNKKLKRKRHKLHNDNNLFIGYRCSKCYKKYSNIVLAFAKSARNPDLEGFKEYCRKHNEQKDRV
ncbi:hypothetical protein [Salirhabdus sp. Marseille-P4669]|uniref:hypothetical protein n=1 Tax=Salirhabdus sp. Marseille-P4669 TaxID=2042310 RepID=UPI000C7A84CA|nr:hypothetical protein [Salirhabdus sp. Marseille-P4669]